MSQALLLVPVLATMVLARLFWRINLKRRWFTTGEMIFWTIVLLIVLELVSLIWL
jgi:hypothetical protein